ncbi:MAG TPA: Cj0069 family protein [Caulobacteraceae bacterium]|nr:Cj0069 family protein [Caulobacteraceae bacterium]
MSEAPIGRVGLLWRGDPSAPPPEPDATRLRAMFASLADVGLAGEAVVYDETAHEVVRERLFGLDGVLVWVDPLSAGKTRERLDPLLREVAAAGLFVSADPDVIMKMGVKEVLHRTRSLSWDADTDLYVSFEDFCERFPARLAAAGPRVIKQNRANGGQGVWKVELAADVGPAPGQTAPLLVLHALRGSNPEAIALSAFTDRCRSYFEREGRIIDQAYQGRLPEGMIRCYFAGPKVVGFGAQIVTALVPAPAGVEPEDWTPGARVMHPPQAEPFQALRRRAEGEWVPAMQRLLDISDDALPVVWDADFLLGAKSRAGEDTYVLCEINISAVFPYPDTATAEAATRTLAGVRAARAARKVK